MRDYHSREARLIVPLSDRADLDRFLDEHFQELTELVKGSRRARRTHAALHRRHLQLWRAALQLHRHPRVPPLRMPAEQWIPATCLDHRPAPHPGRPELPGDLRAPVEDHSAPRAQRVASWAALSLPWEDGVTTTLGRGGSDYTAAIVGAGIDAEEAIRLLLVVASSARYISCTRFALRHTCCDARAGLSSGPRRRLARVDPSSGGTMRAGRRNRASHPVRQRTGQCCRSNCLAPGSCSLEMSCGRPGPWSLPGSHPRSCSGGCRTRSIVPGAVWHRAPLPRPFPYAGTDQAGERPPRFSTSWFGTSSRKRDGSFAPVHRSHSAGDSGPRQDQRIHRARHAHVAKPPLFFQFLGIVQRPRVRKQPSSIPARNTSGNSSPFAACSVISVTRASGSNWSYRDASAA